LKKIRPFILLLSIVIFISACGERAPVGHTEGPPLIVPVMGRALPAVVDRGPVTSERLLPAVVRVDSVPLFFAMDGLTFDAFHVLPGETVYEGQLLATLYTERRREQIADREAALNRLDRANALSAEIWTIDYQLMQIRYNERLHTAAENFDEAAMADAQRLYLDMDRARLEREQQLEWQRIERADALNRLNELRETIKDTELRAPFDGEITYINVISHGAPIHTSQAILYIMPVGALPFVEYLGTTFHTSLMPLPNSLRISQIRRFKGEIKGQIVDLTHIPITREEAAYNSLHELQSRVRFTLPEGSDFPVGSHVRLFAYLTYVADTLRVPANAVFSDGAAPYVYRWEEDVWFPVFPTFGVRTSVYHEILDGLSEGDVIRVR
jgi:multidrug efflux pump subunit AcrA (membrane-fusion protein)